MPKREIKTTLALDGERQFKQALSDAGRQLRVLGSEMKANTSAFSENASKIDMLRAKNENLGKQAEQQREIIAALSKAVEESAKINGDASKKTDEWRIKLNNAATTLNKMEGEVRANAGEIDKYEKEAQDAKNKTVDLSAAMAKAGTAARGLGSALSAAGKAMGKGIAVAAKSTAVAVAAIGTAAIAAAKGVYDLTKSAGEYADATLTMSAQTGVATDTLQEWQYAARFIDTEVEDMTKGLAKVTKAMGAAGKKNKDYIELANGMKISVKGANGEMVSSEEAFYRSVDALGAMTSETERDIAAQELFGKSYQDMMPLIKAGSDGLKKYAQEAQDMGLVLDDASMGALGNFDDTMQRINAQTEGLGRQLAVTFLPAVSSAMAGMQDVMKTIGGALKDGIQAEDIKTIGDAISKKLVEGLKSISKYLPEVIATISAMLTQVVTIIVATLPTLLPALMDGATQLLMGLIAAVSDNMQPLVDMAILIVTKFGDFLITALPQLVAAAIAIVLALANGIIDALPEMLPSIVGMMDTIVDTLIANLPALLDAAFTLLLALADGIVSAIPTLIPAIVQIVLMIAQKLIENLPMLLDATMQIIVALAASLISSLPLILAKIVEMLPQIILTVMGILPMLINAGKDIFAKSVAELVKLDWASIGRNMVSGIWTGIKNTSNWLWNQIKGFFSGIMSKIKAFLGIHSPSKVFAGIGDNMAAGIGVGFTDEMANVSKKINKSIPTSIDANISASGRGSSQTVIYNTVTLDGQAITANTSKHQYSRNKTYSRALGVT